MSKTAYILQKNVLACRQTDILQETVRDPRCTTEKGQSVCTYYIAAQIEIERRKARIRITKARVNVSNNAKEQEK